jgi:hypothetical protein
MSTYDRCAACMECGGGCLVRLGDLLDAPPHPEVTAQIRRKVAEAKARCDDMVLGIERGR